MIFQGSRYEKVNVLQVTDANKQSHPTIMSGTPPKFLGKFKYYTVKYNDRLDNIANKLWNDPNLWWALADANPDFAFYPGEIPAGTLLRIPTA